MAQACEIQDVLVRRVKAEYDEMPGLGLTAPQAARLWGIGTDESEVILQCLVGEGFLARTSHGRYVRRGCPRCA